MEKLQNKIFWESFSFHTTWVLVLIVGIVAIVSLIKSQRTDSFESALYKCYTWSIWILVLSVAGLIWNWQLLLDQAGLAGYVSWEDFKKGFLRCLIPGTLGLLEIVGLYIFISFKKIDPNSH